MVVPVLLNRDNGLLNLQWVTERMAVILLETGRLRAELLADQANEYWKRETSKMFFAAWDSLMANGYAIQTLSGTLTTDSGKQKLKELGGK